MIKVRCLYGSPKDYRAGLILPVVLHLPWQEESISVEVKMNWLEISSIGGVIPNGTGWAELLFLAGRDGSMVVDVKVRDDWMWDKIK